MELGGEDWRRGAGREQKWRMGSRSRGGAGGRGGGEGAGARGTDEAC